MSRLNVRQTNKVLGFNLSFCHDPSNLMDILTSHEVRQKNKKIDGVDGPFTACLFKLTDKV